MVINRMNSEDGPVTVFQFQAKGNVCTMQGVKEHCRVTV